MKQWLVAEVRSWQQDKGSARSGGLAFMALTGLTEDGMPWLMTPSASDIEAVRAVQDLLNDTDTTTEIIPRLTTWIRGCADDPELYPQLRDQLLPALRGHNMFQAGCLAHAGTARGIHHRGRKRRGRLLPPSRRCPAPRCLPAAGRCRMRWPWQHPLRTTACSRPRLLPTATDGISFEAVYTIVWRPRRRSYPSTEEAVRTHIHTAALNAAARLSATDLPAAQDAVNAALPHGCRTPHYRLVSARAALQLPVEAADFLKQQQADDHRIRRLRFLKTRLYDHPDLVVLDRLEHHSPEPSATITSPNSSAWPA